MKKLPAGMRIRLTIPTAAEREADPDDAEDDRDGEGLHEEHQPDERSCAPEGAHGADLARALDDRDDQGVHDDDDRDDRHDEDRDVEHDPDDVDALRERAGGRLPLARARRNAFFGEPRVQLGDERGSLARVLAGARGGSATTRRGPDA